MYCRHVSLCCSTSIQLDVATIDELEDKVGSSYPELLPSQWERSHSPSPAGHSLVTIVTMTVCPAQSTYIQAVQASSTLQGPNMEWMPYPRQTHAAILTKKQEHLESRNWRTLGRKCSWTHCLSMQCFTVINVPEPNWQMHAGKTLQNLDSILLEPISWED